MSNGKIMSIIMLQLSKQLSRTCTRSRIYEEHTNKLLALSTEKDHTLAQGFHSEKEAHRNFVLC